MKHRYFRMGAALLAMVMVLSLCACGGETTVTTMTAPTTTTAPDVTTTVADEVTTTVGGNETTTTADVTTTATKATTTVAAKTTTAKPSGGALTLEQVMASMPANLKNTTLTFVLWEDLHNLPSGKALTKFEQETGIKVNFNVVPKDTYTSVIAGLITAGNSPDIARLIDNNIGTVKNMQPFTNSGYDISTADWDADMSKLFTFGGRTYAVSPKNSPNHNLMLIEYSKLAIKRAKMDDPYEMYKKDPSWWTWDKFFELCDEFLEKTGRKNGYFGSNLSGESYVRCFGGGLSKYDINKGKYVCLLREPETVKRFEILIDAIEKKWSTTTADSKAFAQGKILFNVSSSSYIEKDHPYYTPDTSGYMPIPTDSTVNAVSSFQAHGIVVGAKNKEAVPYFVRYVFGPEANPDFFSTPDNEKIVTDMIKRGNYFFSNGWNYHIWNELIAGTSSQVKSICDKYAPEYEADCADANNEIANLPK